MVFFFQFERKLKIGYRFNSTVVIVHLHQCCFMINGYFQLPTSWKSIYCPRVVNYYQLIFLT